MKRVLSLLLLLGTVWTAAAQRSYDRVLPSPWTEMGSRNRFAWEYDADFQLYFDNREFARSQDAITPSMTVNAVVFTPTAGFSIQQNSRIHHRLTVGAEFFHNLGSRTWRDLPREALLFYDAHVRTRKGMFEGLAGIFPRRYLEGKYSEAFFSDSLQFADRNLEGLLLKWRGQRFYAELGCDWMGQAGYERRERFQIISAGAWQATRWFTLGWNASFYHYAGSQMAPGVVDNHLLEPWIQADFAHNTQWDELSLQAGLLASYQWDRKQEDAIRLPLGGEFTATARRRSFTLRNTTYTGGNLQPLYAHTDLSGAKYGHDLYFGQPFYTGFYDRLELAWTPELTHYLSLRVAARAHFSKAGFLGWQQQFSLRFNLDALRNRDFRSGRCL